MTIAPQAMDLSAEPLPDYDNPPVVETVLGVQFDKLPNFRNAHLGAFWSSLDHATWPVVADAPLLASQFETFQEGANWTRGVRVQVVQDPASRLQIKNRDGDRMIQIQNNRLHLNWLGKGGADYPRYKGVRDEFFSVLNQFTDFITRSELGEFRPNQWEVTYVNHILKGTVWNSSADWCFFKLLADSPTTGQLVEKESFGGEWHFTIPPARGRLHVEWQHGKKASDDPDPGQEYVRLTLTGRGPVQKDADPREAIRMGFELGHERIVRTFKDLMTDEANKYWGLKNATG